MFDMKSPLLINCRGSAVVKPILLLMLMVCILSTDGVNAFLPRNSRAAAKEAYVAHLQNELETTRRQLYTSQNTCSSLRKRVEDQRQESLLYSAATVKSSEKLIDRQEEKEQLMQQKKEIERLQTKLQHETKKFREQVEKLTLLEADLKELKEMKVQSNTTQVQNFEHQLKQSQKKQREYKQEVQLLTLKLEAAEVAARQRQGEEDSSITRRTEELQTQLQSVRQKYTTLLLNVANDREGNDDYQKDIEREMDQSLQLALESTLKALEEGWETRYAKVEKKLNAMSKRVESAENEKAAAVRQLEAVTAPSSTVESNDKLLKEELTESLTDQLTEQLTAELEKKLSKKIERKYRKKYKQMQKELDDQKKTEIEVEKEQRRNIEAEISIVREQCELEFEEKLNKLQNQVQLEKERMRKLVRALLEREAKQKNGAEVEDKVVKKKKKKGANSTDDTVVANKVIHSTVPSSRRKKRPRKGVPRPTSL